MSDNSVIKSEITNDNKDKIEEIFKQCQDGQLYDIVIVSHHKYKNLSDVKIRYLNYVGNDNHVTLKHP